MSTLSQKRNKMQPELKEKLEKVVELVYNLMADPDIDIEYCIPEVATTSETCDTTGVPYICQI